MLSPYKIARKILPLSIQALLGNRHKVKRATLDQLLFSFTQHPHEKQIFYEKSFIPMLHKDLEENPCIPSPITEAYRGWYNRPQNQQVTTVSGDVWIEPATGWPMGPSNQLYLSLYPAGISPYMATPSYAAIWRRKPQVYFEKIINLRDVNEAGYSHFYNDLVARLVLIKQHIHDLKAYTVIIAKKTAETAYARHLIAHMPIFKQVGSLFYQDREFVHSREAIFAHPHINATANLDVFHGMIAQAKASHRVAETTDERRIFLSRAPTRRRAIRNQEEITEIVKAKGFEVVDTDLLALPAQIELFTQCRHIIGIHGAGLINILYRSPRHFSLFEIREPVRPLLGLNMLYQNMAVALGADYGATLGEKTNPSNQSFYMPADRFEADFNHFWSMHGTD